MAKKRLPKEIRQELEEALKKCYSCNKCTSGCPVATEMEYPPSILAKAFLLGEEEELLKSKTLWLCTTCQNCYSRCPFEVNIPEVIDLLKEYVHEHKLTKQENATRLFHEKFLANVKRWGRINELPFIGEWKLFSGNLMNDLALGWQMFSKGKLPLALDTIKHKKEVRKMFKRKKAKHE